MSLKSLVFSGAKFRTSIGFAAVTLIAISSLIGCGGSSKPLSVSVTAAVSTVDGTDTTTLSATVAQDKNAAGVTWSVSGGGTLSSQTTTSATYTAPAATSSAQTVTVTATSVAEAAKTGTATITVAAAPTVTTASSDLAGAVGTAYSVQLKGSGGIAPYKNWALAAGSSALPACLTLSSAGVLTTASGTAPTASCAGTYTNLIFTYTDSGTPNALTATSQALSLTITAPSITFAPTLGAGAVGTAYAGSVAATGAVGATTYSLASGSLGADLTLNTSTGAISGTPKASDAGTFTFTVKVVDAYGDTATSGTLGITITAPTITFPSTLPAGVVGTAYAGSAAATGAVGATTYTMPSGSLPADLSLNASTGAITGTPKASDAGTFTFTVKVVDAYGDTATSGTLSLTITAAPAITFGTAPTATATAGVAYSSAVSATGGAGALTYSITVGSLPSSLNLNGSTGAITGTPTTVGVSTFTVQASDSFGDTPATQSYTITVNPGAATHFGVALTSSSTITAGGTVGFTVTALDVDGNIATGYSGTVLFTSTDAQAGLAANSTLTSGAGSFSATLKTAGSQTVTATDTGNATITGTSPSITVGPGSAASLLVTAPSTATDNVAFNFTVTAKDTYNNTATGFSDTVQFSSTDGSAVLPSAAGLTSGTGTFSATLKTLGGQTITATDSANGSIKGSSGTITVSNTVTIATVSINSLNVGQAASQTLTASGGSGITVDYSWSWTGASGSSIPPGLSLSTAGAITGTPTTAGPYTVAVTVKDTGITPNQTYTQNFTITINGALSLPAPNPSSLPGGYVGVAYTGSVSGSGGSGTLSIAVTTALSPANGTLATGVSGATVNVTGTPANATSELFGVTLTDTTTGNSISQTYTIAVTTPTAPSLPAPGSTVPGSATDGQSYNASIMATGGVGPTYTWTVNSTTVSSSLVLGASGLSSQFSVSNSGSSTLSITGSPTSTGSVSFTAQVKDITTGLTSSPQTYTITVNAAGSQVSGQISLNNNCNSSNVPPITVSISTSPVQTTTTDGSGNYSFASVPNGTYTITPSITGPSSVFLPATQTVTVSNNAISGENFSASLGYTVSGTVTYSGTQTGQIYLNLVNSNCGNIAEGTSISALGSFTIRGLAPGTYSLQAWMDISTLGQGHQNTSDPTGTTSNITVSTANLTGQSVTLNDPASLSVGTTGPKLKTVSPFDQGVVINYGGGSVSDSNGVEMYTSYTVQWATSTAAFSSSQQVVFKAVGRDANVWILHNNISGMIGSLSNSTAYFFRAMGSNATGNSPWSVTSSATTVGQPSSGDSVSGTITIPSSVTVTSGAKLYAGVFNQNTNTVYAEVISSPVSGSSGNAYTVHVPSGSGYTVFGILDQNNDGLLDAGDVTNVLNGGKTTISVSGTLTGQNVTLPSGNSAPSVSVQYYQSTSQGQTNSNYSLNFNVQEGNKLPVAVTLTSGPNVLHPIDLSNYCQGCGGIDYFYNASNVATPTVGDAYVFTVKYSDGTQDTSVTANVTAFGSTGALVGASDVATSLSPTTGSSTSTTPAFAWKDPANASNYLYQFYLQQNNGNTIWQIPGNSSNSSGFASSFTSLTWGTDPTGGGSTPTVTSLVTGATYEWSISAQDTNGNQAVQQVEYIP